MDGPTLNGEIEFFREQAQLFRTLVKEQVDCGYVGLAAKFSQIVVALEAKASQLESLAQRAAVS